MISPFLVGALGVPLILAAIMAAASKNLVRALFWLALVLAGTAVLFVILGAAFLATMQALLYIGGVVVLLIFGVMLTSRTEGAVVPRPVRRRVPAAAVALGLFAVLATAIVRTGDFGPPAGAAPPVSELAGTLLGKDLLAFEALSLLLLAVMIGAIVLARSRDHGAAPSRGAKEHAP